MTGSNVPVAGHHQAGEQESSGLAVDDEIGRLANSECRSNLASLMRENARQHWLLIGRRTKPRCFFRHRSGRAFRSVDLAGDNAAVRAFASGTAAAASCRPWGRAPCPNNSRSCKLSRSRGVKLDNPGRYRAFRANAAQAAFDFAFGDRRLRPHQTASAILPGSHKQIGEIDRQEAIRLLGGQFDRTCRRSWAEASVGIRDAVTPTWLGSELRRILLEYFFDIPDHGVGIERRTIMKVTPDEAELHFFLSAPSRPIPVASRES